MAAPLPTSDLAVHFAGRLVIPSQEDAERIERAADILVESLDSLVRLASDAHTCEALTKEGNARTRSPVHIDVERVVQTAQEALSALSGRELDAEQLGSIHEDLLMKVNIVRQIFEQLPEEFVRRPADLGAGYVVTGEVVAGMLGSVGGFYVMLDLLEDLDQ